MRSLRIKKIQFLRTDYKSARADVVKFEIGMYDVGATLAVAHTIKGNREGCPYIVQSHSRPSLIGTNNPEDIDLSVIPDCSRAANDGRNKKMHRFRHQPSFIPGNKSFIPGNHR